jgi:hypothetical protein
VFSKTLSPEWFIAVRFRYGALKFFNLNPIAMSTKTNFPKVASLTDFERRILRRVEIDLDEEYYHLLDKLKLKYENIEDSLFDGGYRWTIYVYYQNNEDLIALFKSIDEIVPKYEPSYDEDYEQYGEYSDEYGVDRW